MCLTINKFETEKLKEQDVEFFIFYKVLDYDPVRNIVYTPYRNIPIKSGWFIAKPRLFVFFGPFIRWLTGKCFVNYGIHVFQKSIDRIQRINPPFPCITDHYQTSIKVKCYKKDLIAAGYSDDVAFTKIWIEQADLDNFVSKCKNQYYEDNT